VSGKGEEVGRGKEKLKTALTKPVPPLPGCRKVKKKTIPDGKKQKKKTGKGNNSKEDSFNSAWCRAGFGHEVMI